MKSGRHSTAKSAVAKIWVSTEMRQPLYFGHPKPSLTVLIDKTPSLPSTPCPVKPPNLAPGELAEIVAVNSNHWRKVFNVYAKLLFALHPDSGRDWQSVRDQKLFQKHQPHALKMAGSALPGPGVTLITGKAYAESLLEHWPQDSGIDGVWIDVNEQRLVCPYFDYRAFPNKRIEQVAELMRKTWPKMGAVLGPDD